MQVNRMFAEAIFAIERKPNDFIWIQDYHLTLLCQHLREKEDPDNPLKVGFFLHTPFELDKNFVYNYAKHGIVVNLFRAVIEGMLHCNKVGFQTHKDRNNFIELVNYVSVHIYEFKNDIQTFNSRYMALKKVEVKSLAISLKLKLMA